MPRITEATSVKARELAEYIDTKYGNRSGVLSRPEANRALAAVVNDPVLKAKMQDLFATTPQKASELIRALFTPAPPALTGEGISVGNRAGGPGAIFLQPDGSFSIGPRPQGQGPIASAPALYEGALLVAEGKNPFASASAAVRARSAVSLEASAKLGAERAAGEPTASETTMQLKSGSATALLALAEAASAPEEAAVRQKAMGLYLDIAEKEIHRGLRTSMALNLDAVKANLGLTTEQVGRLDALVKKALPDQPPYEEWFKNGNDTIKVKHYVHEEFYDQLIQPYIQRGFTRTTLAPGRELFEGTLKDPAGRAPDTKFRVEIFKVEDYSTDRQMLRDMNDPEVQVEMYTGHSNLGGNISMALRAAPKTELGTKLVQLGMCRGKQNVAEFTNRFPNAHLVTTSAPEYGYGINMMTSALLEMIAARKGYDSIKDRTRSPGDYLVPNDRRLYDHRDLDVDGRIDGGGRMDKVFDIYPRAARGSKVDFRPGESVDPAKLDGTSVVNALAFSNTLLTYHVEHGDGRSPITGAFTDKMIADGYYKSEGDEFMRVTPETVNGATQYRVAINSKHAGQSEDVLGMRALYELNRYITQQRGAPSLDDKLRGMLLASEWIAYMVGPGRQADELVRNMGRTYGWPPSVTHSQLASALERDRHGYVSMDSVTALKQALGPELGDGSNIQ
ncbi:MAG: hypothetical protein HYZ28_20660 [Myxococcales bacterium]|nr:hypothetical protein [Myxococcales bacterium]